MRKEYPNLGHGAVGAAAQRGSGRGAAHRFPHKVAQVCHLQNMQFIILEIAMPFSRRNAAHCLPQRESLMSAACSTRNANIAMPVARRSAACRLPHEESLSSATHASYVGTASFVYRVQWVKSYVSIRTRKQAGSKAGWRTFTPGGKGTSEGSVQSSLTSRDAFSHICGPQ